MKSLDIDSLQDKVDGYLDELSVQIPHRRVGSKWNLQATDLFAEMVNKFGYEVEKQWFDCLDWQEGLASVSLHDLHFQPNISPYSLGCDLQAPLVCVSSGGELDDKGRGSVLLLRGEIAREQLMPKNFPFFNPESHQEIIRKLERITPQAIIAATGRNPELAGGMYPFPLIEDGDFDIPSVYVTEEEGERLAGFEGERISIRIDSTRLPAKGCNVSARIQGSSNDRIVCCAHIDSKGGTPGALDNATGVISLLLLAELAQEYVGNLGFELLAMNGEDHYSAAGEIEYLRRAGEQISRVWLVINIDSPGYRDGRTAYTLYGCPESTERIVHKVFTAYPNIVLGDPWYQGDHSIFIQQSRPAIAITSEKLEMLSREITHTPQDNVELVDPSKLIELATALHAFIRALRC